MDRAIDGKDAPALLLAKSPTMGRNFYTFFGGDDEAYVGIVPDCNVIFRYTPGFDVEAIIHGYGLQSFQRSARGL